MDIGKSMEQILASKDVFGTTFYEVFFERCPQAAQYFDGVDMKRQALVITMALTLVEQYHSKGYSAVGQYLRHIGTKHSDLGVPRALYDDWRDAMLVTLEKFHGKDWDDSLAAQWRDAIDSVSTAMFDGYDHRVGI